MTIQNNTEQQSGETAFAKPVPEPPSELSNAERAHAKRDILVSNLFAPVSFNIVAGQYMMLFASDVLKFDPMSIATIFALIPIVSILRIALVHQVRRFGRIRAYIVARIVQCSVVLFLLVLPFNYLSLTLLTALLMVFLAARELGVNMVWSSLIREITTTNDRGRYLGRLQFAFAVTTLIVSGGVILLVGDSITGGQYRILLALALIGLANACFWAIRIPDPGATKTGKLPREIIRRRSFFYILRHSPLLRLPVLVSFFAMAASLPLAIVYFRQVLQVPADLVTLYVFTITLGQVLFFYIWGQMADTMGFRPMLIGLLSLTAATAPLIFFVPSFAPAGITTASANAQTLIGTGALLLLGLSNGILTSGILIVTTSIQHYHVRPEDSLEAMNLFAILRVTFQAIVFFLAGAFLTHIVIPIGVHPVWNGIVQLDAYKIYAAVIGPLLLLLSIPVAKRLPNLRPWFRVGDFFSALIHSPGRTVYASRRVYHEVKEKRVELARWFGVNANPMVINPLIELLRDPSYDVKVEAIRSLARTNSSLAGEELAAILADDEHRSLWDQTAWALGELKHLPALDLLVDRLSPEMPPGIRAMSARALGKLGDPRAVVPLAGLLEEELHNLSIVSAASLALLQLNSREHVPLAFRALLRLRNREDRYELMNAFCEWLEIPSRWLLHSTSHHSSWESLNSHLELHSTSWRRTRQPIIRIFLERDHGSLLNLLENQLGTSPEGQFAAARALLHVARQSERWSPLSVLAIAWLLYSK